MTKTKRIVFSTPAIAIAIIIFILSNGPLPNLPTFGFVWEDKILHTTAYFVFGLSLIFFLISNFQNLLLKSIALIAFSIGAFYGITDEVHQLFVPGRQSDILDWVADVVGILLSIAFIKFIKNKLFKDIT
jgi:VanZ family protein